MRVARRVGSFCGTALAAALLLLACQAVTGRAAFITYPHTWTLLERLNSIDLNAQFNAVAAQVNGNLDDTNVSTSAAIQGAKLADAPLGVTTTKLNDLQVTVGKLAVNASRNAFVTGAVSTTTVNGTQLTIATVGPIVLRGGLVRLEAGLGAWINFGDTLGHTVTFRWKRGGAEIAKFITTVGFGTAGEDVPVTAAPPFVDASGTTGSQTYTLTVQTDGGLCSFVTSGTSPGVAMATEGA